MIGTGKEAAQMRHDQSDEGDWPRRCHRASGQQYNGQSGGGLDQPQPQSKPSGIVLPQRQHIKRPRD
ncbi:hypothetical protein D3C86_1946380 [compost metagenome]